jgi:hypothetical protein
MLDACGRLNYPKQDTLEKGEKRKADELLVGHSKSSAISIKRRTWLLGTMVQLVHSERTMLPIHNFCHKLL